MLSLMYLLFLLIGFLIISKFNLFLSIIFFIPIVFWIFWAKVKRETWDISNRENRIIPLIFTLIYSSILAILWRNIFIIIFLVNVLVILITTKFWKISMHNYGLSAHGLSYIYLHKQYLAIHRVSNIGNFYWLCKNLFKETYSFSSCCWNNFGNFS